MVAAVEEAEEDANRLDSLVLLDVSTVLVLKNSKPYAHFGHYISEYETKKL